MFSKTLNKNLSQDLIPHPHIPQIYCILYCKENQPADVFFFSVCANLAYVLKSFKWTRASNDISKVKGNKRNTISVVKIVILTPCLVPIVNHPLCPAIAALKIKQQVSIGRQEIILIRPAASASRSRLPVESYTVLEQIPNRRQVGKNF